jgi:hypothetical protein
VGRTRIPRRTVELNLQERDSWDNPEQDGSAKYKMDELARNCRKIEEMEDFVHLPV